MKIKGKKSLFLIIGFLLIQSISPITAEIVWEEDFETPPFEWTRQGHEEVKVSVRY